MKEENKETTYPELMQKASKAGSPDKLLKDSHDKGLLVGLVAGIVGTSLLISLLSMWND